MTEVEEQEAWVMDYMAKTKVTFEKAVNAYIEHLRGVAPSAPDNSKALRRTTGGDEAKRYSS